MLGEPVAMVRDPNPDAEFRAERGDRDLQLGGGWVREGHHISARPGDGCCMSGDTDVEVLRVYLDTFPD